MSPQAYFQRAIQAGKLMPDAQMSSGYAFGGDAKTADALSQLVVRGVKTATTTGLALYQLDNEPLPAVGAFDVILDGHGEPVAVTVTTDVTVASYASVGADYAAAEGEGDRTLAYWRRVHDAFFTAEYHAAGLTFDPATALVVQEHFRVIA